MDQSAEQSATTKADHHRRDAATAADETLTAGEEYWRTHEIVRRTPEETRRGEAPAYVRRRSE